MTAGVHVYVTASIILLLAVAIYSKSVEPFATAPKEKSVDIIISRYKEDLEWLKLYKDYNYRNIIIYNKGPDFKPPFRLPNMKVIKLPNVGVCDHTYLYHIVNNYDNLADITIFLPGSADLPTKYTRLDDVVYRACELKKPTMYVYDVESVKEYQSTFEISHWRVSHSKNVDNNESFQLARATPRPFGKWYEYYLPNNDCPYITYTGIFSLSKETIHKNSVSYYNKFLEQLKYHKFPEAAHYVERSWAAFFHPQPKDEIKNYIN